MVLMSIMYIAASDQIMTFNHVGMLLVMEMM